MNIEQKKTVLDDNAAIYQRTEETESKKSTRQKLSEMTSWKAKLRFLWDYYGLATGIILAVAILVGAIIYNAVKPKPTELAHIAMIDCPWDPIALDEYDETILDTLGLNHKDYSIVLGSDYHYGNTTDETSITTFLFAKTLDIIIAPKEVMDHYISGGAISVIGDTMPKDILDAVSEEDYLTAIVPDLDPNTSFRFAICLTGTPMEKLLNPAAGVETSTSRDMYLGIVANHDDKKTASIYNVVRVMLGLTPTDDLPTDK